MSGIDFLKTCRTNVRVIDGLLGTRYTFYKPRRMDSVRETIISAAITLRRSRVLCSFSPADGLWVFELPDGPALADVEDWGLEHSFERVEEGTLEEISTDPSKLRVSLWDRFLDAYATSLTFLLAQTPGLLPVGPLQYLFTPQSDPADYECRTAAIIKIQSNLTQDGVLHLSTSVNRSHLVAGPESHSEGTVDAILAPYSCASRVVSKDDCALQNGVLQGPAWEAAVALSLLADNIVLEEDEQWLFVTTGIDKECPKKFFSWPARLCLHSIDSVKNELTPIRAWSYWFNSSPGNRGSFEDPIRGAEEWFIGGAERALASTTTPVFDAPTADTMAGISTVVVETPMATSPPFNQRLMDQQAAAMGIYPTPPDGFAPNQNHLNPTSDGPSAAMPMDTDNMISESELPEVVQPEARGDSMESVRDRQSYESNSDDLFGEMTAEMDFGVNEVGDADFDYFDDPDEIRERRLSDQDLAMDDLGTNDEHSTDLSEDTHNLQLESIELDTNHIPATSNESAIVESSVEADTAQGAHAQERLSPDLSTGQRTTDMPSKLEKPLSPFGIRERLLPPPIPASAIKDDPVAISGKRAGSTFDAVLFNENVDLSKRYPGISATSRDVPMTTQDISLPSKPKKHPGTPGSEIDSAWEEMDDSTDDDSHDAVSINGKSGKDLPPRVPWDTKKRKRNSHSTAEQFAAEQTTDIRIDIEGLGAVNEDEIDFVLTALQFANADQARFNRPQAQTSLSMDSNLTSSTSVKEIFELSDLQLNLIAQMVSEQAVSTTRTYGTSHGIIQDNTAISSLEQSLQAHVEHMLQHLFGRLNECKPTDIAAIRETATRPVAVQNKAPQAAQPRMAPRDGSMHTGPDYFPLPPPFISIYRGTERWEMLPAAAPFWTALGLGPASGPKDITAIFIAPGNEDLLGLLPPFMQDLANAYESSKLGHFKIDPDTREEIELGDDSNLAYENGILAVSQLGELAKFESAIAAYAQACEILGGALGELGLDEPDRTIVICMLDPFEDLSSVRYLCGCFWKGFNAYRQSLSSRSREQPRSDLVLQIIPVSAVAAPDTLVMLDAQEMSALAMEIYDRCPPFPQKMATTDIGFALPIMAAPAIELGNAPGRRIAFHLISEAPSDPLREGSVLHLAFALSSDRQWMVISWIDSTGRYQMTTTSSLRGKSFRAVAKEVWDRTVEIISVRDVMWRVFIVTNKEMESSIQRCWRDVVAVRPRKQVVHVTLLSVDDAPSIRLSPSAQVESTLATPANHGSGFLTPPVTTPSASGATVSPDASGHTGNAPPTPTPTETLSVTENDPDAYLLDVTDESWGMLLSPSIASETADANALALIERDRSERPVVTGMLFRRGESAIGDASLSLDALSVGLHWDIRIRPDGGVDEGPPKQPEATLREVLRMYRQLALLGRLRKVCNTRESEHMLPVHMLHALRGVEALDGYLG